MKHKYCLVLQRLDYEDEWKLLYLDRFIEGTDRVETFRYELKDFNLYAIPDDNYDTDISFVPNGELRDLTNDPHVFAMPIDEEWGNLCFGLFGL